MSDFQTLATQNFKRWSDSLLTLDPAAVAALYTENNDFLPTQSGEFKHGRAAAEGYFHHFLEKHPVGRVTEESVQALGEKSYLHSGHYNFELDDGQGGRQTVEARFSFVWTQTENGDWLIAHHHSSVRPQ
jgi:uncharacterized protein (TIGR02246 family)